MLVDYKVKSMFNSKWRNKWKITSAFDHSIFQVEQEAVFKINEDNKINKAELAETLPEFTTFETNFKTNLNLRLPTTEYLPLSCRLSWRRPTLQM